METCELAIVGANADALPGLVAEYVSLQGDSSWGETMAALRSGTVVVLRDPSIDVALPNAAIMDVPTAPTKVSRPALLLALGRVAGAKHVFLFSGEESLQLFPADPLQPFAMGLPAVLPASPAKAERDATLAFGVGAALGAAARFDYLSVATEADRLRAQVDADDVVDAARARANLALTLLDHHGISLAPEIDEESATDEAADAEAVAPEKPRLPAMGTPYGDFIAVRLGPDRRIEWTERRASVVTELDDARAAILDGMFGPEGSCPTPVVPPMSRPGDLYFGSLLAMSLEQDETDPARAGAGKLVLSDWLPQYDLMLALVQTGQVAWAMLPSVLSQRGGLHGLSAEGTASYRAVTALASKHFEALDALANAHPARFRALSLASYAYLPGVLADRQLRDTLGELVKTSAAAKLTQAADVSAVFEAAFASFMSAMSYPPPLQTQQFFALDAALGDKLAGPFGAATKGWGITGLFAAHGALGLLLQDTARLKDTAKRIGAALTGTPDLPYPGLAKLTTAAVNYARLIGSGALDATVANPRMWQPDRIKARDALAAALSELADGGPANAPDTELRNRVAALADGLIALVAAKLTAADDKPAPSCGTDPQLAEGTELRDSYERVLKTRREMLESTAWTRGDTVWLRRVRLIGLVLSDIVDVLRPLEGIEFQVATADGEKIVEGALGEWEERELSDIVVGGYALARAVAQEGGQTHGLGKHTARVLVAVGKLFGDGGGDGLFAALSRAGKGVVVADADEIGELMVTYADEAYKEKAYEQGDLFLIVALGASMWRHEDIPERALTLATEHDRPIRLPLLLHGRTKGLKTDPAPLFDAMRRAAKGQCDAPSPEGVIRLRKAEYDFRTGKRKEATASLDKLLVDIAETGAEVPSMTLAYHESRDEKVFKLESTFSFAARYLNNSGSLQLGLGYQSIARHDSSTSLRFAKSEGLKASEESARLYAHAAVLASLMHFVEGDDVAAARAARLSIAAWAHGIRLGSDAIVPQDKTGEWAGDATAKIALAAQLAADRGHAFLAGDLWTLVRAVWGNEASDATIDEVLDPLDDFAEDVPELVAVAERAKKSLRVLGGPLPCTTKQGHPEEFEGNTCAQYPLALSLRVAQGLATLPRLGQGVEANAERCLGWRALDRFLVAAGEGRYEPDRLVGAVEQLREDRRDGDAAMLLARQRHPNHCSADVTRHARALARNEALGIHLRADLLSIAANCGVGDDKLAGDLELLDQLTAGHADPRRNLEVVLFAARIAVVADKWEALRRISERANFVQRWQRMTPELGTSALLLHHAAQIGSGAVLDPEPTLPYYRLLCTTYPQKQRAPLCNTITLLRGAGTTDEKRRAAKEAIQALLQQIMSPPG